MIKFFRKIRQKLLSENKFSKYLIYAIGEIVLVVIGILIALSINNWNQNRLDQSEKNELLSKLEMEFRTNKKTLNTYIENNTKGINSNMMLLKLVGASSEELSNHNLDSIFFNSFLVNDLAFSENAVQSIVLNGRLFKNEEIVTLLNQWDALSEMREQRLEKLNLWTSDHTIPFLLSHISFKEMDANGNFEWTGKSKVKPDYFPLFQKVEFENLIDNALWYYTTLDEKLEETDQLIDKIINSIKSE